jgi:hypothetical protein
MAEATTSSQKSEEPSRRLVKRPDAQGIDVILVGSFNPAIFHPQWFLRHNLIGEEEADPQSVKVISSDVTEIRIGEIRLVCIGDRLTLGTQNIAYEPKLRDLLEGILSLLPHTPVRACGINPSAHYQLDSVEYWHKIGHTLAPKDLIWKDLFVNPGLKNLSIQSKARPEDLNELNITIEPSTRFNPGVFIHVNNHFGLSPEKSEVGGAALIKDVIKTQWSEATNQVNRVAARIFEKIKPNA